MNIAGASCNLLSTNSLPKLPQLEAARRSANYHPSVWGDYFLINPPKLETNETAMEERHNELREEVRKMLVAAANDVCYQLNLIDQIQRLGISYHFEDEIDAALENAFETYNSPRRNDGHLDLHTTALHFRLFRQQGHNMSSDAFQSFLDDHGKFKESLTSDLQGLLSLYEASHMRVHGEDILDRALEFSSNHLNSMISNLSNTQAAAQVADALKQPLRKHLQRLEARRYISVYTEQESYNKLLSSFAKIDFNILQKSHQRELSDLTRWWKELNFEEKLPFARDRLVECFFWILGVYFEPKYSLARKFLTKVIILTSVLDDIYDVQGTIDELILLTDAIERWDLDAIHQLPGYMREFYRPLLDVYSEMEEKMESEGRSYSVRYAKAAMKKQATAYFEEAKWLSDQYAPTFHDYMDVAIISSGELLILISSFVGMEEKYATEAAFKWFSDFPLVVQASSTITRLRDDMVGHEFEQERGHLASAVECYMKEHDVPKEEVYAIFRRQILNTWKDINQAFIRPTAVPMPLLTRLLNFARVMDILYSDKDGYTHSNTRTKDLITSLLVDPLPM